MYNKEYQEKLVKTATNLSIFIATLILLAKTYAWMSTKSVSILASLVDSALDISASFINLIAVRLALQPADDNHRFGHNKIQDLAVFAQSIFFFASSIFIILASVNKLYQQENITSSYVGIYVMLFSTFLTIILVSYQAYVIKKTKSGIVEADRIHYVSDIMANIAVIVSIFLSTYMHHVDSIFGILIALYLIWGSYKIFRSSLKNLLDEEFSDERKNELLKIFAEFKQKGIIHGVHDIKTRRAAEKHFIQFHLELDPDIDLFSAHEISEKIEEEIEKKFPYSEIIVHKDPAGHEEDIEYKDPLNV